ncbi:copper-transporting P-type ATPase [Aaosphaeria arxii CBS 175.79]|uniref:Copper-transporting P-type ATPase n=1 Tax=Aaosphaeria arxii CBS 175.79 TaxID=1450172 RepID=A0A6A5XJF9_9PLEO|nr:copper-transporting P-type ATPase [Aaosphaeria arxii CBS 175.79]KAF2013093.1 copper-transporting P-type ATPase [Aaosphaeria arxii CBS 175.79]
MLQRSGLDKYCEKCSMNVNEVTMAAGLPDSTKNNDGNGHGSTKSSITSAPLHGSFFGIDSSRSQMLQKATFTIEGMTCSSCVSCITHAVGSLSWIKSVNVNLLTSSGTVVFEDKSRLDEIIEKIEDAGFDAYLDTITELPTTAEKTSEMCAVDEWRAVFTMTSTPGSASVADLGQALDENSWIRSVDVDVLSNTAYVAFTGRENLRRIEYIIEQAGYNATIDTVIHETVTQGHHERLLSVAVAGMSCHHCPIRIVRALTTQHEHGFKVKVVRDPPFSKEQPIITLRYRPSPPFFTARHILTRITTLDQALQPSIYHHPTIEERAQKMHSRERKRILLRLLLTIIVGIPSFTLGIVFMSLIDAQHPIRKYFMQPMWIGNASRLSWALFFLATPVYFFAADIFHRKALKEIYTLWRASSRTHMLRRFYRFGSMNMLISLGTTIAYFASVAELALAAAKKTSGSMSDSYFDAVVFLTMFLLIGRYLEAHSKAKTGDAVISLGRLRPTEAVLVIPGGSDQTIATNVLETGDIIRVPHGASPPFDGMIIHGMAVFDEASLTGESRLVPKEPGDMVYSGTINKGQSVEIRLTTISGTSMLDQIINAVREGQTKRAPVERIADAITGHFVPLVVLVAIGTWVTWVSLGTSGIIPSDWKNSGSESWALWSLRFAIAVFVIACPCGIGLAAPTALFVGGGLAANHGILVKGGGQAFQEASRLDHIVFDKTGTLTLGCEHAVADCTFIDTRNRDQILGMISGLEQNSSHPIARAIVSYCDCHESPKLDFQDVEEIPGKGLKGALTINEVEWGIIVGSEAHMSDYNVAIPSTELDRLQWWKRSGKSVALVAMQSFDTIGSENERETAAWSLIAAFAIADVIRPEVCGVIRDLQTRGIDVWMLSGDNVVTACAVGIQVGIPPDNIIAGVLPDQKADKIRHLQRTHPSTKRSKLLRNIFRLKVSGNSKRTKRAIVAMVGDGINDSVALSAADVSIAIGSGSDIAISSSSFVLINSNLGALLTLLDLSRVVLRRVYLNFMWAGIYNIIAMPVAAGVLYPITTGTTQGMNMHHNGVAMEAGLGMGATGEKHIRLDPVWAALAMALSSVSVVLSSLALRSNIPGLGFRARKAGAA